MWTHDYGPAQYNITPVYEWPWYTIWVRDYGLDKYNIAPVYAPDIECGPMIMALPSII